jgi:hypothetical protein
VYKTIKVWVVWWVVDGISSGAQVFWDKQEAQAYLAAIREEWSNEDVYLTIDMAQKELEIPATEVV